MRMPTTPHRTNEPKPNKDRSGQVSRGTKSDWHSQGESANARRLPREAPGWTDWIVVSQPWTFTEESEAVPHATVTLVGDASFAICDSSGDITGHSVEGLFVGDTRTCSRLRLLVDDRTVEALGTSVDAPFAASFVGRTVDRTVVVYRDLWVGKGLRMDVRICNLTRQPLVRTVSLDVAADLADLFAVKEGRALEEAPVVMRTERDDGVRFEDVDARRGLVVRARSATSADAGALRWKTEIGPGEEWHVCLELAACRGGQEVVPQYRCGESTELAVPTARQESWQRRLSRLTTNVDGLEAAFDRACDDLGALRLFDADHSSEPVVAAGAPWFMTLFGRDSILTSWMALPLDPELALSTCSTLARLQGRENRDDNEEQPGRILHEVRFSRGTSLALEDGDVYYGSVDATPLYVTLVHELWRWGIPLERLEPLLPSVDAALKWMAGPGDPDGDGYLEYERRSRDGLVNQGWKDSFDSIAFADGRLAEAPIALAEVQGYAYAAWRAGAELGAAVGDHQRASDCRLRADELQGRFQRDFWLDEQAAFAIALDAQKRPVDAIASNMGHCLWSGIVHDADQAAAVAKWLVSPELFSGWGVRTLATSMARYNALSYHNGSVWPHDTAICIAGLRRAGFRDEATTLARGLLTATKAFLGRLPELFAGLGPDDFPMPVSYPAACSPQAWASAAPLLVMRVLLGLEPDVPNRRLQLDPVLGDGVSLRLEDLRLAGTGVTIEVDGDAVAVRGLPRDLAVVRPGA
jgi:glycogen debranching enzyme